VSIDVNNRPVTTDGSDPDPVETKEWLESVDAVVELDGRDRAAYLLDRAVDHAQDLGVHTTAGLSTPYVNTIPVEDEPELPGDPELERLATALVRWNAVAIVLQANAESTELGGHIASYQSAETLYEVGFNHFWRARSEDHLGDLVYIQGHSSPGIYARAYLEGRLSEEELRRFR
jgi:pyruvate dehydrogenase E1 component